MVIAAGSYPALSGFDSPGRYFARVELQLADCSRFKNEDVRVRIPPRVRNSMPYSQTGKAPDSGSGNSRFESWYGSHASRAGAHGPFVREHCPVQFRGEAPCARGEMEDALR